MATMLSDRELKKLISKCILHGSDSQLKGNSYELRLGSPVLFQTTLEKLELPIGKYLEIGVGEAVTVASLETIDFRKKTVQEIFPESLLMGFVTPTTTMMREGISDVATIVDAGFRGSLNWLLKNDSSNPNIIKHGESLFKITIFKLDKGEIPEKIYGEREKDFYFEKEGIVKSARQLEAQILEEDKVKSSEEKLDPKKRLQEAGGLWSHVSTELVALDGKIEEVYKNVLDMKKEFSERTINLSDKISTESSSIGDKLKDLEQRLREYMDQSIDKFSHKVKGSFLGWILTAVFAVAAIASIMGDEVSSKVRFGVFVVSAILVILVLVFFTKKKH